MIEKLQKGKEAKRSQIATAEWKKGFEDAYNTADDETKAWLDGFVDSYNNDAHVNSSRYTKPDQRERAFYKYATEIAQSGIVNKKPAIALWSDTDPYQQMQWLAYEYNKRNLQNTLALAATSADQKQDLHYNFVWNKGLDSGYYTNSGQKERANAYIDALHRNLVEAKGALGTRTIHGLQLSDTDLESTINSLNSLKLIDWSKSSSELNDYVSNLKNISQRLGINPSDFNIFFKEWSGNDVSAPASATDTNKKTLNDLGYYDLTATDAYWNSLPQEMRDYLRSNKISLMRNRNNKLIAVDPSYNRVLSYLYANKNYTTSGKDGTSYDYGFFTDAEGNAWVDKFSNLSPDSNFFDLISNYIAQIKENNKALWSGYEGPYIMNNMVGPRLMDELYANNYRPENFYDVSSYFESNRPIIAFDPLKKLLTSRFNDIILTPDTHLAYIDDNGILLTQKYSDYLINPDSNIGRFSISGWRELSNQAGFDKIKSLSSLQMPSQGKISKDRKLYFGQFNGRSISEVKELYVTVALDALRKLALGQSDQMSIDENGVLNNAEYNTDKDSLFIILHNLISHNSNIHLTPEQVQIYRALYLDYLERHNVAQHKNGGVLFMQEGNIFKSNQDILKGLQNNTFNQQKSGDRKPSISGLKPTDWAQIGILAADLASIVTSFIPGGGTMASMIIGGASSVSQLGVDIAEDGFQWKDVGNFLGNAVMDIAGAFTGGTGKLAKTLKIAIKATPFVLAFSPMITNADDFVNAWKHLVDGKGEPLTVDEWKIIARGITLIAGMTRVASSAMHLRALKNNANGELAKLNPKDVKVGIKDSKGNKQFISLENANEIANAKNYKEANDLFHTAIKKDNINLPTKTEGHLWNKKISRENPLTNVQFELTYSPSLLRMSVADTDNRYLRSRIGASDFDRAAGNTGWLGWATKRDGGKFERLDEYLKNRK